LGPAGGVQENLESVAEVTAWNQNALVPGTSTIEGLVAHLERTDFAVLVLAPDDRVTIRGEEYLGARDNVLFELGLAIGKLGPKRAFFMVPSSEVKFRLPSDLFGFTTIHYDSNRADRNWKAATATACRRIDESFQTFVPPGEKNAAGVLDDIVGQLRTLLAKQLSTEYIGVFPLYIERHICACLKEARKRIYIACDVVAYGAFSAPTEYEKYMEILEQKNTENVEVRLMVPDAAGRKRQDRAQFADCSTDESFKAKRESDRSFERLVRTLSTNAQMAIPGVEDFFAALTNFELEEIAKHKGAINLYENEQLLPIHFWIADRIRAVFTIPSYAEDASEHGFTTTDANLIACLQSIWHRYAPRPATQ